MTYLPDYIDTLDDILLRVNTTVAETYQNITGQDKRNLENLAYIFATGSFAASASYDLLYNNFGFGSIVTLGAAGMFGYIAVKKRMVHTENIPAQDPIWVKGSLIASYISGIFSLFMGTSTIAFGLYTSLPDIITNGVNLSAFGMGFIFGTSGIYIGRTDTDPPSGKSVITKINEKIRNMFAKKAYEPRVYSTSLDST